jgi:tight adherence protein C
MTPDILLALVSVFVAAMIITIAGAWLLGRGSAVRRRLDELAFQPQGLQATGGAAVSLADTPDPRLRRLTRLVPKSPKNMNRLERRLARAGWHGMGPLVVYMLAELALPLVIGMLTLSAMGVRSGWLLAAFAAVIAYLLPGVFLAHAIAKRRKLIGNGLPDALDLLIVCVEAGLSLDQAIVKASEELFVSHPALAEELRTITTETRAGKPRLEALRNFASRTGLEEAQSLVTMLVQTDRFGTSIAQALRTQAEVSRTKRRQRAEERAQKLGVKLVFPLVFCLFPAMYVVTIGPAVIKFVRVFFQGVMQQ